MDIHNSIVDIHNSNSNGFDQSRPITYQQWEIWECYWTKYFKWNAPRARVLLLACHLSPVVKAGKGIFWLYTAKKSHSNGVL